MSFWKDMSMFPEAIWYLTLLVMNSWGHRRTWIPFSPVSLGMASPPVSLLRQNWGHLLVFCENFVNVNDKGNIQQFPSSRCGSVFDRAEWGHGGLCLEWQSFTHLSRKAIWSNKNPKGSWQLPGGVCATAKTINPSSERADHSCGQILQRMRSCLLLSHLERFAFYC